MPWRQFGPVWAWGGGDSAISTTFAFFGQSSETSVSLRFKYYAGLVETLQVNELQELTGENVLGNWVVGWLARDVSAVSRSNVTPSGKGRSNGRPHLFQISPPMCGLVSKCLQPAFLIIILLLLLRF